jgi:hypothetical protein
VRGHFVLPDASQNVIAGSVKRENLDLLAQWLRWMPGSPRDDRSNLRRFESRGK